MEDVYVGIDPGATGAVAVFADGRWSVADAPVIDKKFGKRTRKQLDPTLAYYQLRGLGVDFARVFVEKQQAMPGQGVSGVFSLGRNYGIWLAVIAACGFPVTEVTPRKWKNKMVNGIGDNKKEASRQRALQLFPYLADQLARKKDHGRAEALLLGEYGRLHA